MNRFLFSQIFQFVAWQFSRPFLYRKIRKEPLMAVFMQRVIERSDFRLRDNIVRLNRQMQRSEEIISIEDFGAGSKKKGNERKVRDIARFSASSNKKGMLLYNMVHVYKPKTVIELGTSLGFGAMYLGSSLPETKVISIEGSKTLHELAARNINQLGLTNINLLNGKFDEILPELLLRNNGCDLLFVDGNHTKESTLLYFNLFLPYAKPGSIVIFDDIRWSAGMYEAWREICRHSSVYISIDLFTIGIVFLSAGEIKRHYRIYSKLFC